VADDPGTGSTHSAADAQDQKLRAWIERNVGGAIESFERHVRWRAGWWVDVRRAGERLRLYVRGAREEEYPPWPIEREAGIMTVLERHGIPVPHIYGICPDPHAVVMSRAPGRHNLATAEDEAERLAVLEHLAGIMAAMHRIDPAELVALGVALPRSDEEIALGCFDVCEALYVRGKRRPDPRIEFLRRWVRRNVPRDRKRVAVLHCDSGQFVFEKRRITAMLDFEFACLGDPLIDLANLQARAIYEPMGDLQPLFRRYRSLTGETLDHDVLCYHSVWWLLSTPLVIASSLYEPLPGASYYDHVCWYSGAIIGAFECLADRLGVELEEARPTVGSAPSRWSPIFDVLAARLGADARPGDPYDREQREKLVEFARRVDAHKEDAEAAHLRDAGRLLGRSLRDWEHADCELEAFVLEAGPEHDAELVRIFHRWCRRQGALFDGLVQMPNLVRRVQPFREMLR
jgi:aminoglycoside phosphotransferase (APT) family kinase protein